MRTVKHASQFRRDYKQEKSGRHSKRLDADLLEAVTLLAKDEPLPARTPIASGIAGTGEGGRQRRRRQRNSRAT